MSLPFPSLPRIRRFPGGMRLRLAAVATMLVAGVALGGALLFSSVAEHELRRQFEATMASLAKNLARNAAHGVFIESGEVLEELVGHLMEEPDVFSVEIFNERGERISIAEPRGKTASGAPKGEVFAPVLYDAFADHEVDDEFAPFLSGTPPPAVSGSAGALATTGSREIGKVKVVYSLDQLEAELRRVRFRVWLAAGVASLLGSLIGIWLADRMVKPLSALSQSITAVAEGDLDTRVDEIGDDEIAALAHTFNSMTDALRASRKKLTDTYDELARKDRLATMGQFTAVIAHELKNPLGVILSSAQVINNPKRTPEMKEKAAQFIVEEVRRLNTDLVGFLNFARPKPPELKPIDLADVARRAVDAWRGTPGSHAVVGERTPTGEPMRDTSLGGILTQVHAEADRPLASADSDQIHQLLLNLLFNAAQAMTAGRESSSDGPPPMRGTRIDVRIRAHGDKAALIVEDDGPGIPDDVRTHIFEPFFTTKKRGSGLGLAVVDQIARAHGGSVELHTEAGKGTRFTILLPAAIPAAAASKSAPPHARR